MATTLGAQGWFQYSGLTLLIQWILVQNSKLLSKITNILLQLFQKLDKATSLTFTHLSSFFICSFLFLADWKSLHCSYPMYHPDDLHGRDGERGQCPDHFRPFCLYFCFIIRPRHDPQRRRCFRSCSHITQQSAYLNRYDVHYARPSLTNN